MSRLLSIFAGFLFAFVFNIAVNVTAQADEPVPEQGSTVSRTGDRVKEGATQIKDGAVEGAMGIKDAAVDGAHKVKEEATAGAQQIKQDTHGLGSKIGQAARDAWQAAKNIFSSNSSNSQPAPVQQGDK